MSFSDEQNADVASVMDAMLNAINTDNRDAVASLADIPMVQEAQKALDAINPEGFYFALNYPFDRLVDGVLQSIKDPRARFVFHHQSFLNGHFRALFEQHEGSACCADKSRWITRALAESFIGGKPIVIDRTQKYTYHLPTRLFNTHDEIVEFFEGLYRLFYGRSEPYLHALMALHGRLAVVPTSE